jgi:hypothetical protein
LPALAALSAIVLEPARRIALAYALGGIFALRLLFFVGPGGASANNDHREDD